MSKPAIRQSLQGWLSLMRRLQHSVRFLFVARQHEECDVVSAFLSVCLSITSWYCIWTDAHVVKVFPPSGRHDPNCFECYCRYTISRGTPSVRVINTQEVGKIHDFQPTSPFISEMIRDGQDTKGQFFRQISVILLVPFDPEWPHLAR